MTYKKFNIIGLGELLWDLLPTGEKMLGGTTANFAYIAGQLANNGIIASRVGNDANGVEALEWLKNKGVPTEKIQIDEKYPTGTVIVSFNNGQPEYEVTRPVAWDFLELTSSWHDLALTADAVCFGTLAQRNSVSRETIQNFVSSTKQNCLRVSDVNLRQDYYSKEVLETSLNLANIVKMNHEELPIIVEMFDIKGINQIEQAKKLRQKFDLKAICITRGGNGSLLVTEQEFDENAGVKVEIADTIGAGDAFTATMTHGFLNNWDVKKINTEANKIGAYVASKTGAMPDFK
jgi:fructokinase